MRIARHMLPVQGPVQLRLFHALPGGTGIRDQQDLMSYPFFSLAKGARAKPIEYELGQVSILVEGVVDIGIATIWDADVLIWAASQIAAAHNMGMPTSRYMASSMHDILRFIGRGVSLRDYQRLRAALDRLQSTTVITTLSAGNLRKQHRFSWINEWRELAHTSGRSAGLEVILPDWFYAGVVAASAVDGAFHCVICTHARAACCAIATFRWRSASSPSVPCWTITCGSRKTPPRSSCAFAARPGGERWI